MDNLGTYYLQLASKVEGSLLRLSLYLVESDTISKADSVRIKLTVEHPADIMVYYLMWGWGGGATHLVSEMLSVVAAWETQEKHLSNSVTKY